MQPLTRVCFVTGLSATYSAPVSNDPPADPPVDSTAAPRPLLVAALLTSLEAAVLVVYAVLELANLHSQRVAMGLTTAAFFAFFGLALLACAWGLTRAQSWARAPVVGAQLVLLGTAWSFRGGETTWVWLLCSAVALLVILGLLLPESRSALAAE